MNLRTAQHFSPGGELHVETRNAGSRDMQAVLKGTGHSRAVKPGHLDEAAFKPFLDSSSVFVGCSWPLDFGRSTKAVAW